MTMNEWQPARLFGAHGRKCAFAEAEKNIIHVRKLSKWEVDSLDNYTRNVDFIESRHQIGCYATEFFETKERFGPFQRVMILCEHEILTD